MLALGLLLLVGSGVVIAAVALSDANGSAVTLSGFGASYDTTLVGAFLAGAVLGALALLGLALLFGGAGARRRRRRSRKAETRAVRDERDQLAQENEELRTKVQEPYPAERVDVPAEHRRMFSRD